MNSPLTARMPRLNGHLTPADNARLHEIAILTGCTMDHVAALHEREWQQLEARARIRDYLPLLTMKHVREVCRREQHGLISRP